MYLFILESIGTQEIMLIAAVALMIFGPRKLPEMMKTVAKTIAEFKKATNEFKSSWEREIDFEEAGKPAEKKIISLPENSTTAIQGTLNNPVSAPLSQNNVILPGIKELNAEEIKSMLLNNEKKPEIILSADEAPLKAEEAAPKLVNAKQNWL